MTNCRDSKTDPFSTPEKGQHGIDWHRFHDKKQKELPTSRLDPGAADAAAKSFTEKFKSDGFKANKTFEQHQPEERWRDIRNRELPH